MRILNCLLKEIGRLRSFWRVEVGGMLAAEEVGRGWGIRRNGKDVGGNGLGGSRVLTRVGRGRAEVEEVIASISIARLDVDPLRSIRSV